MAAASKDDVACPDPTVHSRYSRDADLQASASKAALLAADSHAHPPSRGQAPRPDFDALGPDGRLSAAGAAASLKYAKAQDLPSFPSVGIDTHSSGNKAANLASANFKSPEYPKTEISSSAGRAALLAHRDGSKVELWKYKADGTGMSAASIAMGIKSSPQLDYGYTEDGRKKALLAATLSLSRRKDAPEPTPTPSVYPDSQNSAYNALNAASVANNRSNPYDERMSERATEASRVHNLKISPEFFGERPPVKIEEDERNHKAALRASAVSMAKALYDLEKPAMDKIAAGDSAARKSYTDQHGSKTSGDDMRVQAMNYVKVQEAAQKLAAERLAKLDPDGVVAYREHYGYGPAKKSPTKTSGGRRYKSRSADDEDDASSGDEAAAARIKSQMSLLNNQVAAVDLEKRQKDRDNLLVAAQKSVQAKMNSMDEKVFAETGKASPAMVAEWDAKARAKASADSEARLVNHGRVHIGGGKYMDQAEIDAIAQGRMQPTLDEITQTAADQRTRDAEIKADQERRAEEQRVERQKAADLKQAQSDLKAEQKRRTAAEKAEQKRVAAEAKAAAKQQKLEAKARAAEEKRAKRTSTAGGAVAGAAVGTAAGTAAGAAAGTTAAAKSAVGTAAGTTTGTMAGTTADTTAITEPVVAEPAVIEPAVEAEAAPRIIEAEDAPVAAVGGNDDIVEPEPTLQPAAASPITSTEEPAETVAATTPAAETAEPVAAPHEDKDIKGRAFENFNLTSDTPMTAAQAKRQSRVRSFFSRIKRSSTRSEAAAGGAVAAGAAGAAGAGLAADKTASTDAPRIETSADVDKFKTGTGGDGTSAELAERANDSEAAAAVPATTTTTDALADDEPISPLADDDEDEALYREAAAQPSAPFGADASGHATTDGAADAAESALVTDAAPAEPELLPEAVGGTTSSTDAAPHIESSTIAAATADDPFFTPTGDAAAVEAEKITTATAADVPDVEPAAEPTLPAADGPVTDSPSRSGSKFQEEL